MRLNPPKKITFWVAVGVAALGVVVEIVHLLARSVGYLSAVSFVLVLAAFVLLVLGLILKGL